MRYMAHNATSDLKGPLTPWRAPLGQTADASGSTSFLQGPETACTLE